MSPPSSSARSSSRDWCALAIVLIGTLWPLAAEAMGDQISVGPPYFKKATMPLAFLLMILLAIGPMLLSSRL